MTNLTAHQIATKLNDWMDENDWPRSRAGWTEEKADEHYGANVWNDLISGSDWYDEDATDEADQGRSDTVVTTDGDTIRWVESERRWVVA